MLEDIVIFRRPIFALVVPLAVGCITESAYAQTTINVAVDATAAGTPLERIWAYHGYDEINYTTVPEGESLLHALGSLHTIAPHIRSHFYLNSGTGAPGMKWGSTNVYTLGAGGSPVYDWTLMDGITDALTGAGTKPLVEIGFMPHDLSTHPDPYADSTITTMDSGCFYPPKDYAAWGTLISTWAKHTSTRYADAEATWQWELWNEPELNYWHGTPEEYNKLFDYTEAALHQVMPMASLGAPASYNPSSTFLKQFLQHCATGTNAVSGKTGARLDMISFHAKGGTAVVGNHVEMDMGNQLRLHKAGFSTVASFAQYKKTPIVITEGDPDGCAACQTAADTYRRVPAYGAYEIEMMKRSLDLESQLGVSVRGIVAWAFLFPNQPYFADYRVLSTHGLALPVLNAFKLLGSLGGSRLPVTSSGALSLDSVVTGSVRAQPDIDAMATLNSGRVQVLVWNYHDDIVAANAAPIHMTVTLPTSFGTKVSVAHQRMDDTHGNAYATWLSQGSPTTPSATQLTQLQTSADGLTFQPSQEINVVGGVAALDFALPRFGVSLVTLSPAGQTEGDASTTLKDASTGPGTTPDATSASSGADAAQDAALGSPGVTMFDAEPTLGGTSPGETDATAPTPDGGVESPALDGATSEEGGPAQTGMGRSPASDGSSGCSCHATVSPGGAKGALAALAIAFFAGIERRRRKGSV